MIVFDVGANNGCDSYHWAQEGHTVYAFEPTPELCDAIRQTTKQLNISRNYNIYETAVSDYNGRSKFNVSEIASWGASSLLEFKPDNVLNKIWEGRPDLRSTKQIEVDVIRLDSFIEKNNIKEIDYFECDTQGNDLNVLIGLGDYYKIIKKGVVETATNNDVAIYENQKYVLKDILHWLKEHDFEVNDMKKNDGHQGREYNVYFSKK